MYTQIYTQIFIFIPASYSLSSTCMLRMLQLQGQLSAFYVSSTAEPNSTAVFAFMLTDNMVLLSDTFAGRLGSSGGSHVAQARMHGPSVLLTHWQQIPPQSF